LKREEINILNEQARGERKISFPGFFYGTEVMRFRVQRFTVMKTMKNTQSERYRYSIAVIILLLNVNSDCYVFFL